MARRDAHVPRGLVARTMGFEQLEDRWLLSSFSAPSDSQPVNLAVNNALTAPFVSAAPMDVRVVTRAPDSAGDITASDAGSSLVAVGRAGSTSEVTPPLYNSLTLPASIGTVGWPGGAIGVPVTFSGGADQGIASIGTGPALSNTPTLASVSATIQTAKQAGGYSLLSQPSAGSVAAPASGNLFIQPSSGVLTVAGGSGQTFITSSALGFGGLVPVDGFFRTNSAFPTPQAVAINLGDPTIQESPAPLAVATPGAFLLTPLVTTTTTSYAKTATNGASSLGAVPNLSNVATPVGISTVSLALSGPTKVSGNANGFPAMDLTLTLTGRGVAQVPPFRDISKPGNQRSVATTQADLPRIVAEANLLGLAVPSPQRSDLIMDFMPFDQAAVGQTIDRFLQQLEDLGAGLSWIQGPTDVIVELLAVAVALTAWKVVSKILGHSPDEDDLGASGDGTSLEGISSLPGGSSPEES
jgi:hypothetical protein